MQETVVPTRSDRLPKYDLHEQAVVALDPSMHPLVVTIARWAIPQPVAGAVQLNHVVSLMMSIRT